jgi:hypothetical protein
LLNPHEQVRTKEWKFRKCMGFSVHWLRCCRMCLLKPLNQYLHIFHPVLINKYLATISWLCNCYICSGGNATT